MSFIPLGILAASGAGGGGAYESIATLSPSGTNTVTFTSIPSTYKSLQIRAIMRSDQVNAGFVALKVQPNSATSTYADHRLFGNGTTASASSGTGRAYGNIDACVPRDSATASTYGVVILDIIDYASTTKAKTFRAINGVDLNGTGQINLSSFLWTDTTAISSIALSPESGNWKAGTTIALYGIKGA